MADRDSELGVVIEDSCTIQSTMNGKPYHVGQWVKQFRIKLWMVGPNVIWNVVDGQNMSCVCQRSGIIPLLRNI